MELELNHVGSTRIYTQSTMTSARLFFPDNVGMCAEVQMPWDPAAVRWCTLPHPHVGDHYFDGGPAPFPGGDHSG